MSKLLLTVDHQFKRTPDGQIWVKTIYGYDFWKRYLEVFDSVRIACRVEDVESIEEKMLLANGERVEFFALPQYRGAKEFVLRYADIKKSLKSVAVSCNCAIFRIPSPIANLVQKEVIKAELPWATEIVNDPWDNFSPRVFKSIFRPIYRIHFTHQVKKYARIASGVSYVTQFALQERYPSYARQNGEDVKHFESYYSSIDLREDYFWKEREFNPNKEQFTVVHVNSCITDFSKGHDVVIKVAKILRDEGMNVRVIFVGDGPKRRHFEKMAEKLDLAEHVIFTGLLSSAAEVRQKLIESDIMIFPTLGEGLPRTVIEAMAVGLPCLSSPVNGIPELLEESDLISQKDIDSYAKRTMDLLRNYAEYKRVSIRNLKKAHCYVYSEVQKRRIEFYSKLYKLGEKYK
jgi:glycosyltransferase involved in cell wall biosynthesis